MPISGVDALRAQLRLWLENPKVNSVLLTRGVFKTAIEVARLHEDMHQYNPKGLALITQRVLSNRHVRRRILALAPDRKHGREAMDALRRWADAAAAFDPLAKGN